jgi:hypothetical protein
MLKPDPLFTIITVCLGGVRSVLIARSRLTWLVILLLSGLMFFGGRQETGWAALVQHPLLQTIPTRPPEPTPKREEGHEDNDDILPVQSPENVLPSPSLETEDGAPEDETQPLQPSTENNEPEKQLSPTSVKPHISSMEPARPDLPGSTEQVTPAVSSPTVQAPTEPLALPSTAELLAHRIGSLGWLYTLALGLILILSGIFLVKRA